MREADAIKELTKENCFVGGVMERNIFCIARGVSYDFLFLGGPGDHATAKGVAVPADGSTRVWAVCIIRVRIAKQRWGSVTAQDKRKRASSFQVAEHMQGGRPVVRGIALEE